MSGFDWRTVAEIPSTRIDAPCLSHTVYFDGDQIFFYDQFMKSKAEIMDFLETGKIDHRFIRITSTEWKALVFFDEIEFKLFNMKFNLDNEG